MSKVVAQSEKTLLQRTERQLILWFAFALVIFAALLLGSIYYVLQNSLLQTSYQEVEREWQQKVPEALHILQEHDGESNTSSSSSSVDTAPEDVATWVFSAHGEVVRADYSLAHVTGSVKTLFQGASQYAKHPGPTIRWEIVSLRDANILLGIHPLYQKNTWVGTLISAYSLAAMQQTMHVFVTVDIELGLASLILIIILTFTLARRSLRPVRHALQRQRNFVNDAAHELRTPLTILRGNLELAHMESSPALMKEAIKLSLTDVDYISDVVSSLSTLARYGLQSGGMKVASVNVSEVLTRCVQDLTLFASQQGVSLEISMADSTAVIQGNAAQLRQLFVILLENAVKYNVPNGAVEVSVSKKGDFLHVSVQDHGIGIPADDLPHIFDRFYRGEQSRQEQSGSGIGLAIAEWIVENHNGRIEVFSESGKGSTFTVTLPLATP